MLLRVITVVVVVEIVVLYMRIVLNIITAPQIDKI